MIESVASNHGFLDGNKRTAVILMRLLLKRSGYDIRARNDDIEDEIEQMVLEVVTHHLKFQALVKWFEARIFRL